MLRLESLYHEICAKGSLYTVLESTKLIGGNYKDTYVFHISDWNYHYRCREMPKYFEQWCLAK